MTAPKHPTRSDVGRLVRVLTTWGYFARCCGVAVGYHSFCGTQNVRVEFADDLGRSWYFAPTELEVVE